MPDFNDLIAASKKMSDKMKEAQEALKKIEVEGISGGDSVKVIMNGEGEMKKISFSDTVLKESKKPRSPLMTAALIRTSITTYVLRYNRSLLLRS